MRRQLVPGPVVRLTVIKAKTRPGIEATKSVEMSKREIVEKKKQGAPGFEPGPLDLQSNALPLSYTPHTRDGYVINFQGAK